MTEEKTRKGILEEAEKCVCGKREEDYGIPENNFEMVADLWNCYLRELTITGSVIKDIKPKDVAVMMMLLKIARISTGNGSMDNWVDIAGYAACGGEIEANSSVNKEWIPRSCHDVGEWLTEAGEKMYGSYSGEE